MTHDNDVKVKFSVTGGALRNPTVLQVCVEAAGTRQQDSVADTDWLPAKCCSNSEQKRRSYFKKSELRIREGTPTSG